MLDAFISASAGTQQQKPHIERVFNAQVADELLTIADHLDSIEHKRKESLKVAQEHGRLGIMELLQKGGAQVVETGVVMVRTDPSRGHLMHGDGDGEVNTPADKFAQVIELLLDPQTKIGGQRIFMDDLVILKGELDPKKVRNRPYDVIQIPKIGKEIAVCDLIRQAMFVSHELQGPKLYAAMNKNELEHVMGMTRVRYQGDWQGRMLGALSGNIPEKVQKVDVADFAEKQKKAKLLLSPAIVGLAVLKYAAAHEGEMVSSHTKDPVPDMLKERWRNLDAAGEHGSRKMPEGMELAAVKRLYGWNDKDNKVQQDKIDKDIKRFAETGEMSPPVMSIEEAIKIPPKIELSPEIVATALLKYAIAHDGKIASARTTDPVPDMPSDTWSGLNLTGSKGGAENARGDVS